ncbi:hypothetical protein GCM10010974_25620 [Brevibacterium sediminis]|uniref:Uncharacterized protein n=1 Tax=Brevibacterium sediminis TaxID=1857024 RepID=A0ABQ1MK48_9MICO|nr:hypothetical protein GCM10010974_25620 [Brevibacterium sediminis]
MDEHDDEHTDDAGEVEGEITVAGDRSGHSVYGRWVRALAGDDDVSDQLHRCGGGVRACKRVVRRQPHSVVLPPHGYDIRIAFASRSIAR